MRRLSRALALLAFGVAVALSGLALTRQVIAVAGEADAERLNRAILDYVAQKNPQAPISAFRNFPETLVAEAQRSSLDHCLALAQADVESEFKQDAVGAAGEIGLFQILPATAARPRPAGGAPMPRRGALRACPGKTAPAPWPAAGSYRTPEAAPEHPRSVRDHPRASHDRQSGSRSAPARRTARSALR